MTIRRDDDAGCSRGVSSSAARLIGARRGVRSSAHCRRRRDAHSAAAAGANSRRSRRSFAGPRRCRFPPPIHFRRRSARSASGCSTTSGCRSTAASRCATCHDRGKGFADGRDARASAYRAVRSRAIRRPCGIWPGRGRCSGTAARAAWRSRSPARSIAPDEMAQPIASLVARLAADRSMRAPLPRPFPDDPRVERTTWPRRSPPTSARWSRRRPVSIAGSPARRRRCGARGRRLPVVRRQGRLRQLPQRVGPSPTTRSTTSVCRARIAAAAPCCGCAVAEHAFKTPWLREIGRSAPYMHDGSLATLARRGAALRGRHRRAADAAAGPRAQTRADRRRARRSRRLPRHADAARAIRSRPPRSRPRKDRPTAPAERVTTVSQHDKMFTPTHVALRRGERLWILNNDTRTHNIRVFDPKVSTSIPARRSRARPSRSSFRRPARIWCSAASIPRWNLTVDVDPRSRLDAGAMSRCGPPDISNPIL